MAAHLGQRDVDVLLSGQVSGRADEPVVVEHVQDAGDRDEHVVLGDHRLGVPAALTAPPVVVPVAEPVPAAAAPLAVTVVISAALLPARVTGIALPACIPRVPGVTVLVGTIARGPRLVVAPGLVVPPGLVLPPGLVVPPTLV